MLGDAIRKTFCTRNATHVTSTELKDVIENIKRFLGPAAGTLLDGAPFTR
jgi:hypothetical protein